MNKSQKSKLAIAFAIYPYFIFVSFILHFHSPLSSFLTLRLPFLLPPLPLILPPSPPSSAQSPILVSVSIISINSTYISCVNSSTTVFKTTATAGDFSFPSSPSSWSSTNTRRGHTSPLPPPLPLSAAPPTRPCSHRWYVVMVVVLMPRL